MHVHVAILAHMGTYVYVYCKIICTSSISGFVLLYCMQSKGLVNKCFLAHCFLGYNKYVVGPQELYECLPSPSGTV